tara:strand:+ start:2769 stop:2990 length:222 start_codon:yes stop_codon:yes gene_type:complete
MARFILGTRMIQAIIQTTVIKFTFLARVWSVLMTPVALIAPTKTKKMGHILLKKMAADSVARDIFATGAITKD